MPRPLLLAMVLAAGVAAAVPGPGVPQQLVVGFDHPVGPPEAAWLRAQGATAVHLAPGADFAVVRVEAADAFRARAEGHAGVRYVERDAPLVLEAEPNDVHWHFQWGPAAVQAPAAWDVEMGDAAVVYAVVDTGVDYLHPDLASGMWLNTNDLPGDGVDNDGNGYADDLFGWDCSDHDNHPYPGRNQGHGTHVAGIAAARTDNAVGVAGMAQVRIMALKVFGAGSFASAAAECIRYAVDNGARVIGMSWATSPSTALEEAIAYAWSKDALLVKSAGNQNGSPVTYPGTLPEVLAVSALSNPEGIARYSSTGPEVELAAPGTAILSTFPLTQPEIGGTAPGNGYLSGTSMAQPHVAGVACLVLSKNPSLTNQDVRDILTATADDLGAPGRDDQYGHGRVNALAAVKAA